jgi:integrase
MVQKKRNGGRNRNGVGGVRKLRENLFQGTIQLAPGDRRYVSGHTRQQAEQKLAELRVLYQQGRLPVKSGQKVAGYLREWLENDVRPTVAPRTYENYELNVRRVDNLIGSIRLNALKPDHIKTAYRDLLEKGLSPRSVQQVHRTLRAALRQAVKSEYLYRDPTGGVTPPRAKQREDAVLTPEQIRALLSVTADHYLHPLWIVLATTGIRLGEALGLQWRDIDFEQGMLAVRRQAQRQKGRGMVLSELKTAASRRSLPLAGGTIEALRVEQRSQRERSGALGIPWDDKNQVFSNFSSGLFDAGSVNKSFHRALEQAGLPQCRVHDLRHMFTSFIQSRGRTEREAQEVLGHASSSTTRNVYTHVMPDRRRDIMIPVKELLPDFDPART